MHVVGDVGGGAAGAQIGVVAQNDARALRGNRLGGVILRRQYREGDRIQADFGQRRGMPVAAQRIGVDLIDQRLDVAHAVADDLRRIAAGGGDQIFSDHQQPEIVSGKITFDNDFRRDVRRRFKGFEHLFARADIDRDAFTLITVARLDDHRAGDFLRRFPGFFGARHHASVRHRHTGGVQQHLGQFLVLRDLFGDGAGAAGFRGLDALLTAAPAELHHAAFGQAAIRNAAQDGRVDDGAGARSQSHVFVQIPQGEQRGCQIEWLIGKRGRAQLLRVVQRQTADSFFGIGDDDLIGAGLGGRHGAAESDRAAGFGLQAQRGDFERVGHRNLAVLACRLKIADLRKTGAQLGFEGGQGADRAFAFGAGDNRFDCRVLAPQIRAAQYAYS